MRFGVDPNTQLKLAVIGWVQQHRSMRHLDLHEFSGIHSNPQSKNESAVCRQYANQRGVPVWITEQQTTRVTNPSRDCPCRCFCKPIGVGVCKTVATGIPLLYCAGGAEAVLPLTIGTTRGLLSCRQNANRTRRGSAKCRRTSRERTASFQPRMKRLRPRCAPNTGTTALSLPTMPAGVEGNIRRWLLQGMEDMP